jgi:transglutaminase-like putative cysteine protease
MSQTSLHVIHETRYRYETRVDVAHHIAHLTPRSDARQQVGHFDLKITPSPSERSPARDTFGNERTAFAIHSPHDTLVVRAESRVRIGGRAVDFEPADSAAWEEVREGLRYRARAPLVPAAEFAYPSTFVPLHVELRAYAAASFSADRPLLVAAIELMHRLHEDIAYTSGATEISTPVLQAFTERKGVCQDMAHMMIGALRALGLPARYVSGYLLTQPRPGQARLLGADASHAWVQVWTDPPGWVDLDPTNDVVANSGHVQLAIGRDYGDVVPLRGVIHGGGEPKLEVAVSVIPDVADAVE